VAGVLERVPLEEFYVTEFRDFRGADGWYRKYRLIFVDREVFPYHLAISRDWLIHYFRTEDMATLDHHRLEEAAFLADWRSVFRGASATAVEMVAKRLDLDYGGIDCSLTADGRVLLFETNASMLVHLDDSVETFPYKHRAVPRIFAAIDRMVARRLGQTGS
jgi:hypothetical protein